MKTYAIRISMRSLSDWLEKRKKIETDILKRLPLKLEKWSMILNLSVKDGLKKKQS